MNTYVCNKVYPETTHGHIYVCTYAHISITCMLSFCEFQLKSFETLEIKVFHTVKLQCESPKWHKKSSTNVRFTVIDENHLGSPTKPKSILR